MEWQHLNVFSVLFALVTMPGAIQWSHTEPGAVLCYLHLYLDVQWYKEVDVYRS